MAKEPAADIAQRLADQAGARAARAGSAEEAHGILDRAARLAAAYRSDNVAAPGHDGNAPEHMEVKDFVYADGAREPFQSPKNVNVDRIEHLFARRQIDQRQYAAASRFQMDWEKSMIQPRASSVIVGSSGGEALLPNDAKVDAMRRHAAAREALGHDWPIVALVIEQQKSVADASKMLGLNPQRGIGWLWSALHHLADHYKLPRDTQSAVDAKISRASA